MGTPSNWIYYDNSKLAGGTLQIAGAQPTHCLFFLSTFRLKPFKFSDTVGPKEKRTDNFHTLCLGCRSGAIRSNHLQVG